MLDAKAPDAPLRLVVLAVVAIGVPRTAAAGCEKDTDCKGDRVCEKGLCRSPADSREAPPQQAPRVPASESRSPTVTSAPSEIDAQRQWFATVKGGETRGPLDGAALGAMARRGELTRDTLLWEKGVSKDWKRAPEWAELAGLFGDSAGALPSEPASASAPLPTANVTTVTVDQGFAQQGDFVASVETETGVRTCRWTWPSAENACTIRSVEVGRASFSLDVNGSEVVTQQLKLKGPSDKVSVRKVVPGIRVAGDWLFGGGLGLVLVGSINPLLCATSNWGCSSSGVFAALAVVGAVLAVIGLPMWIVGIVQTRYEAVVDSEERP